MRYFRSSLRDQDLTVQQWRVLRALDFYGPLEARELARLTLLLPPSLSRILRDLQARRLVTRRTVKADLRRSVIRISSNGRRLIQVVSPYIDAGNRAIAERFGEARLELLKDTLIEFEACLMAGGPLQEDGGDAILDPLPPHEQPRAAADRSRS